jgi:chromatin structure-remodeling complex subunit SFH1
MAAFTTAGAPRIHPPQSFISSYAPRLRTRGNSLLAPVLPQQGTNTAGPGGLTRTTKRGTTAINYAEDGMDDDDFLLSLEEGDEGRISRRLTGLRSLRRDDSNSGALAKEPAHPGVQEGMDSAPVEVQGLWRAWMGQGRKIP